MTNPSKAPHEQQLPHQAPLNVEAAEALLTDFGQPAQEQQKPTQSQPGDEYDVVANAPQATGKDEVWPDGEPARTEAGSGETTLADELLTGDLADVIQARIRARLEERRKQLPSLMGYSLASEAHRANPKESPRPQLFLDQVSAHERSQLTPNDVLLLPGDLILNASDEFVNTFPKPAQEAWHREAAERRSEVSQWTPEDVTHLASNGNLYEIPDEVAQHMSPAAQQAWEKAAGRPISAAPFEDSPVDAPVQQPTQQPKGKSGSGGRSGKGRNKDTTATTQETEPAAAATATSDAQETAPPENYVFSEADGIAVGSPFYGKSVKDLIGKIFKMSDEKVDNLSNEEYKVYRRVEQAAYDRAEARAEAAGNTPPEMVGPESDPGARGKMAKVAAFAGKIASKLRRDRNGEQSEPAVTSENYRVSEEDADGVDFLKGKSAEELLNVTVGEAAYMTEYEKDVLGKLQVKVKGLRDAEQQAAAEAENEPGRLKKLTAALGGVASRAGNLVRRGKNGEGSGEQQPRRPFKERAKELADKFSGANAIARTDATKVFVEAVTEKIPAFLRKMQDKIPMHNIDQVTGERRLNKKGALIYSAAAVGLLALAALKIEAFEGGGAGGGAANTAHDTGETAANQPGAAGSTSSSTEVTTTTTGAPSSSEAADATTGAPSSSTEVVTTTGNPSSSVDTTEAAVPTGDSASSTEADTTTTGAPSSSTEVDTTTTGTSTTSTGIEAGQTGNPGNVGAGEHAIDADTTPTGGPTIDDRYPHNGGTTPSPEAPDASDMPDQSTPEPGAPQTPDTSGMDKVADPANQPAYSPGVSELQPGGNVWDSSEQYWVDRGFKGSQSDLTKLTDAMKDWRLEQMGLLNPDGTENISAISQLQPGTKMPMPSPNELADIIAKSGVK